MKTQAALASAALPPSAALTDGAPVPGSAAPAVLASPAIRCRPAPVQDDASGDIAPVIPMPPHRRNNRVPAGPLAWSASPADIGSRSSSGALRAPVNPEAEASLCAGAIDGSVTRAEKFQLDLARAQADEAALVRSMTAKIGQAAVEVLAGSRPVQQLARWLDARSFEALQVRAELTRSVQRTLDRSSVHSNVHELHRNPSVRSLHCCAVRPGVYESSLVIAERRRIRALAMRMEERNGVWKVTALEIG
ncbi:Rv3235 family protein [Arthrobacter sp. H14-L1]|uniref:Rv3235 family protein n=1 Tax=Arthrobacter sp. H14-L1 TaxID=2996697 RepID=UPI00226F3E4D|nr:Rv3235 family protein [Arthrobacter sp. H14-L1]MCY0903554.1 Rv3235 family protein [Arthrobacter sp. H14-L1]